MALLHFPCSRLHPPLSLWPISSSSSRPRPTSRNLPARDRVIDFGKHKGMMLGALPSKYLLWVSRNLRAGDFEEWARLADEVLLDPVYRDRLEWESAERLLTGDDRRNSRSDSPVADLLEVGGRFGWDTEDKTGWGRVDFSLLGTSSGGRIPRIGEMGSPATNHGWRNEKKDGILGKDPGASKRGKVGVLSNGYRFYVGDGKEEGSEEEEVVREKREERRERQRLKRGEQMRMLRREVGVEEWDGRSDEGFEKGRRVLGGGLAPNPFPGRGALLGKIKNRQGD